MASPAQLLRIAKMAAAAVKASVGDGYGSDVSSAYELMQRKLHDHSAQLKSLPSVEAKIATKKTFIGEYVDWIDGVISGNSGAQDAVISELVVWLIDTSFFDKAIDLAQYMLSHGLGLPDKYSRNLATAIVEEIADAALKAFKTDADFSDTLLLRLLELVEGYSDHIVDQVKAKFYKALGLAHKVADPTAAHTWLCRAYDLDEKCGVLKEIKTLAATLPATNTAVDLSIAPAVDDATGQ